MQARNRLLEIKTTTAAAVLDQPCLSVSAMRHFQRAYFSFDPNAVVHPLDMQSFPQLQRSSGRGKARAAESAEAAAQSAAEESIAKLRCAPVARLRLSVLGFVGGDVVSAVVPGLHLVAATFGGLPATPACNALSSLMRSHNLPKYAVHCLHGVDNQGAQRHDSDSCLYRTTSEGAFNSV